MENQEKATISIDDKSYVIEDLSKTAQYCIGQLQDLQQQSSAARARVDQLGMAEKGFMDALQAEIDKPKEDEAE